MDRNPKRDLPGVKYSEGCGYNDCYTGTKQALIKAGIAKAHWFPKTLAKAFKVNGEPYLRNGKQRTRRKYAVEGITPETSVNHRINQDGAEVWIVEIFNAQRKAEADARHAQWEREYNERNPRPLHAVREPANSELRRDVLPIQRHRKGAGCGFDIRGWCEKLAVKQ